MVSAVPSSPDCTTNASSAATRHERNRGSRNHRPNPEFIASDGNTKLASGIRRQTAGFEPKALLNEIDNPVDAEIRGLGSGVRSLTPDARCLTPDARRLSYPVAGNSMP